MSVSDRHRADAGWRKSSYSGVNECVELNTDGIRDSKDPNGPVIDCTNEVLRTLVDGIKAGDIDDLT